MSVPIEPVPTESTESLQKASVRCGGFACGVVLVVDVRGCILRVCLVAFCVAWEPDVRFDRKA